MRLTAIMLLTTITILASGQSLTGKYNAYYGHSLQLRADSTFRYEWHFDLGSSWSVGQWKVSNKTIYLSFKNVYDTLTRDGMPDSLVLSSDENQIELKMKSLSLD